MSLPAIVIALIAAISPGAVIDPIVVDAVARSTTDPQEIALMVVYAWRESEASQHPTPHSWDSKAGRACGPWQIPCDFARFHSVADQALFALATLRRGAEICPDAPGAPYIGGCSVPAARRQAAARQAEADRILGELAISAWALPGR